MATALGIPYTIVNPVAAPLSKVTTTQGYGANVVLYRDSHNENLPEAKGYAVREARPVFNLGSHS